MINKEYPVSYGTLLDYTIHILNENEYLIKQKDCSNGIIEASLGVSITSWGENIQIKIIKLSDRVTSITISSNAKAQIFTWGKNDENERLIIESLNKLIFNYQ